MWYGSLMDYDAQIKKWAAAKVASAPSLIESVEFELHDGHWYSAYTYDDGYAEAVVTFKDNHRQRKTIPLDRYDFGGVIQEIMDA